MERALKASFFAPVLDGLSACRRLRERFPALPMEGVPGNCDWGSCDQPERLLEIGGVRIFALHGHTRNVKRSPMAAMYAAKEYGAQVLLFGHTHVPLVDNVFQTLR